jgi:hypothetical protein
MAISCLQTFAMRRKSGRFVVPPKCYNADFGPASRWRDEAEVPEVRLDDTVWLQFGDEYFLCDEEIEGGAKVPAGRCPREKTSHVCKYECLHMMRALEKGKKVELRNEMEVIEFKVVCDTKFRGLEENMAMNQMKLLQQLETTTDGLEALQQWMEVKETGCMLEILAESRDKYGVGFSTEIIQNFRKRQAKMLVRFGLSMARANIVSREDTFYNAGSAMMRIMEDEEDLNDEGVAARVLDEFGTPNAVGFGYFILNKQQIGPVVKLETSEDDDSDTDDDDDKTLPMSVDGEEGLATQPEDDDSKCAIDRVCVSGTDSVKSEDF